MKYDLISVEFIDSKQSSLYGWLNNFAKDRPITGRLCGIPVAVANGIAVCIRPLVASIEEVVKGAFTLLAALFSKKYSFSDAGYFLKRAVISIAKIVPYMIYSVAIAGSTVWDPVSAKHMSLPLLEKKLNEFVMKQLMSDLQPMVPFNLPPASPTSPMEMHPRIPGLLTDFARFREASQDIHDISCEMDLGHEFSEIVNLEMVIVHQLSYLQRQMKIFCKTVDNPIVDVTNLSLNFAELTNDLVGFEAAFNSTVPNGAPKMRNLGFVIVGQLNLLRPHIKAVIEYVETMHREIEDLNNMFRQHGSPTQTAQHIQFCDEPD